MIQRPMSKQWKYVYYSICSMLQLLKTASRKSALRCYGVALRYLDYVGPPLFKEQIAFRHHPLMLHRLGQYDESIRILSDFISMYGDTVCPVDGYKMWVISGPLSDLTVSELFLVFNLFYVERYGDLHRHCSQLMHSPQHTDLKRLDAPTHELIRGLLIFSFIEIGKICEAKELLSEFMADTPEFHRFFVIFSFKKVAA